MAGIAFALRIYADELTDIALVPTGDFVAPDPLANNAYQDPAMWFSRPGKGARNDPARWQPPEAPADGVLEEDPSAAPSATPSLAARAVIADGGGRTDLAAPTGATTRPSNPADETPPDFAVFFVHPTSYLDRSTWNAPLDHAESQARARLMVRGMASAFNRASEIWAPRYRQATFGAFLTDAPEADQALESAYRDVEQAFDFFLASIAPDTPIVLAGHSQGAFHVTRLLAQRIKGTPLEQRIAMAYPIGWPISIAHDLPALALPACATPAQGGCIVGWASFAEPAEPGQFLRRYAATPGNDGAPRGESPILCVNPLNGTLGGAAERAENLGTLVPANDLTTGELVTGAVPARCNASGLLLIGDPPDLGQYVLPGNNYHVYDIPLFWKNLQADVVRRVRAWSQARS